MRSYKRKTTTGYSEVALLAAVKAVREQGMSRAAAARKLNVPTTTIFGHISGKHSRIGAGSPTTAEEKETGDRVWTYKGLGGGNHP